MELLLIDHLFCRRGLIEVRAKTWTGNKRMIRVAEECGFEVTGYSPHCVSLSVRGEPFELAHLAISPQVWLDRLV